MTTQKNPNRVVPWFAAVSFLSMVWAEPVAGQGQTQEGEMTHPAEVEGHEAVEPKEKLPGPRFLNLRFDEDFSYLDGEPGSYQPDWFDPIKNIRLDEDWRLSLGGEFRFRMEAETNKAFGATEPTQDTFTLYRYMLHADLKYREVFRVFAQGVATFDEDRDLALRGIDENRWDLHQLFFDVRVFGEDSPLTLRVGRQELQYGSQRYVSSLKWANVRRRFDGVKLSTLRTITDPLSWASQFRGFGYVLIRRPCDEHAGDQRLGGDCGRHVRFCRGRIVVLTAPVRWGVDAGEQLHGGAGRGVPEKPYVRLVNPLLAYHGDEPGDLLGR